MIRSPKLSVPGSGGMSARLPVNEAMIVAAVTGFALVTGAIAVRSIQAASALVLLVLILAIYVQSRRTGLILLWSLWLLAPALRRILALTGETQVADPLALLPFVATAMLALVELRRSTLSPPARAVVAMAMLGFLVGAPAGMLADPLAFGFGLTAYLAAVSAFALGWADRREGPDLSLVWALAHLLPLLAVYGIFQYVLPLTSWDLTWVETVDLGSIGSPQEGHIRIFSTLNSPGTFALVLAIGIILGFTSKRRPGVGFAATVILALALALTFVRSAWLAIVLGLLVFAAAARGKAAGRLVGVIAICLIGLIVVGGSNPTTRAFTQRVTSLGDLSKDESAQERLAFTSQLLPTALSQPLGAGVGQAGLSVRLDEGGESESLTTTDNGYLALIYQVGPIGFLLVVVAIGLSLRAAIRAWRRAEGDERQLAAAVLAALLTLLVAQAAGDMLYGISGAIFWYLAGVAFAAQRPAKSPKTPRTMVQ